MKITKSNKEDLIMSHIDIIIALYNPEIQELRHREKEFLTHSVMIRTEGYDLKSPEAVDELQIRMNLTKRDDVYNYRNRLKKKGWLIQTKNDIILPRVFDMFKDKLPKSVSYKFNIEIS